MRRAIFQIPFCDVFMKFCFQNFAVGVWSSRSNFGCCIKTMGKKQLLFLTGSYSWWRCCRKKMRSSYFSSDCLYSVACPR
ncbi:Haloacid dehalogenase-like hydrolase superfamily protein [Perilla frutescens var. hirtella]|nr:Haloacid dehalogenase-like hydrolase superfamily protein [Perilla frutescens var. hirtella]